MNDGDTVCVCAHVQIVTVMFVTAQYTPLKQDKYYYGNITILLYITLIHLSYMRGKFLADRQ